jgi:hypothetical protein
MLKLLRRIDWWVVAGMLCLVASATFVIGVGLALAQEAGAITLPTAADQTQAAVIAVYAALLPFLVQGIRALVPTMPRILVWTLPPVIGGLVAWLTTLGGIGGWKGLAAGLIAIALREGVSTLKQHGING